jgi:hypothetical protein
MNIAISSLLLSLFLAASASAQQTSSQLRFGQPRPAGEKAIKKSVSTAPECKNLETMGSAVEKLFGVEPDPVLAAIQSAASAIGQGTNINADEQKWDLSDDSGVAKDDAWDTLIECANHTHSDYERAEALRIAAMWEGWRAEQFRVAYRQVQPVTAGLCKDLKKYDEDVRTSLPKVEALNSYIAPSGLRQLDVPLVRCAEESKNLNKGKPIPEFSRAYEDLWDLESERELSDSNTINGLNDSITRLTSAYNQLVEDTRDVMLASDRVDRIRGIYEQMQELQNQMLRIQAVGSQPTSCSGTSHEYGSWGTFTLNCGN